MISESPPKLLIIDDDPTLHLWAQRYLGAMDWVLLSAFNGLDGIAICKQYRPQIILVDVEMPDLDGFSTCTFLRELPDMQNVPILIITCTEDPEKIAAAFAAGANDFVLKPINWQVLVHRLLYMLKASALLLQLQQSEARLSKAQQLAKLGHWEWYPAENRLHWSQEIYAIFQKPAHSYVPSYDNFLTLIDPEHRSRVEQTFNSVLREQQSASLVYKIVSTDQEEHYVHHQLEVVKIPQNDAVVLMGTIQDISERKRAEDKMLHLAYYDEITNLPNRTYFFELLSRSLELAKRHNQIFSVLVLDLDGFKTINDSYGHALGDLVLKALAERLAKGLRRSDITSRHTSEPMHHSDLARMGGDEFTILINDLQDGADASVVAENILKIIRAPLQIADAKFYLHASMGIALYPQDGKDRETLLKNADIAMHHAKRSGKGRYKFFDNAMNAKAQHYMEMETQMHQALSQHELCLYYQPVVDIKSGTLIGAEALMRWRSAQFGFLLPGQFITQAEENGMILDFGLWAIKEVCQQHQRWRAQGLGHLTLAVNISSLQFAQADFVATVKQVLSTYEMPPGVLVFELTESVLMGDDPAIFNTLRSLKELQIKLSLDDFGTGYSSLSYLKRFPLDFLKIDRSFIQDLPHDSDNVAIVNAIMSMAHSLNLKTIAEGVETPEQHCFLQETTCREIQGYFFAKPMPIEEFTRFAT